MHPNKQLGYADYLAGKPQHPDNILRRAGWLKAAINDPKSVMYETESTVESIKQAVFKPLRTPRLQRTWKSKRPMGRVGEKRKKTKEEWLKGT